MRAPRRLLCALALVAASVVAAPAADTAADPVLEARVNAVAAELRCLVCQNQTLADSHAPLAIDLKNQVREQLRAGQSPQQVLGYMTDRYGDFVRYRPPMKASTMLLWAGPWLLLLLGGAGLWRALSKHRCAGDHGAALADSEQRRAARWLGD